jgi:SAM-dependent methyltransferase
MADYAASTYGDRWADVYDEWVAGRWASAGDVDFLAALAAGGRVLELGVGSGRIAIPLAERGLEVVGIDASPRMLELLRAKSDRVAAVAGEMADVDAPGDFDLVYVVFNTIFALLTQDEQVRCFANVAARLTERGVFVVQAFVPLLERFRLGQQLYANDVGLDSVELVASRHDAVAQRIATQVVTLSPDGMRLRPIQLRYAWPSELDLMARLAGLGLRERYETFERRPFTGTSTMHVSVYARA